MAKGEKLAKPIGMGTSLATVAILVAELPKEKVWIAIFAGVIIVLLLLAYLVYSSRQHGEVPRQHYGQKTEERRLRREFPAIFAFVESIGEIRNQRDFEQFVTQLNHLLELERKARGIKWSEVKDIETMKAIAYALLVEKRAHYKKEF